MIQTPGRFFFICSGEKATSSAPAGHDAVHEETEDLRIHVVDMGFQNPYLVTRQGGCFLSQHDAEDVRRVREVPVPCAVSHVRDRERGRGAKAGAEGGQNRCAGRRYPFTCTSSPCTGIPRRSSAVAGAGTGSLPWAVST